MTSVTHTEVYGLSRSANLTDTHHQLSGEIVGVTVLDSFGSDWEVLRPVEAVVENVDGSFVASFNDANINASGDTSLDALTSLVSITGDIFELLMTNEERLAKGPRDQLAELRLYLRPITEC